MEKLVGKFNLNMTSKERSQKFRGVGGEAKDVFKKSDVKETGGKKAELTVAEKFYSGSMTDDVLQLLNDKPDTRLVKAIFRGPGSKCLEQLKEAGVCEMVGNEIKIQYGKLSDLFEKTNSAKIWHIKNENPEITPEKISDRLKENFKIEVTEATVLREIDMLKRKGLLDEEKIAEQSSIPSEKPNSKVVSTSKVKVESIAGMPGKADMIDKQVRNLVKEKRELYFDDIVSELDMFGYRGDFERSIGRLAKEGFLDSNKERIDGKKVMKVKIKEESKKGDVNTTRVVNYNE